MPLFKKIIKCILILVGYLCISYGVSKFLLDHFVITSNTKPFMVLIHELFMCLLLLIIVIKLNFTSIFTKQKINLFHSLMTGGFLFFYMLIVIIIQMTYTKLPNLTFTIQMLFVGFTEEVLFRGIFGEILIDEDNLLPTIIIASIIFGLAHFNNLQSGANPLGVLIQVINASAIGFYFTAIWYRTHNIWALIIIHAMNDYAVLMTISEESNNVTTTINSYSVINLTAFFIYSFLGIFLLRKELFEDNIIDRGIKKIKSNIWIQLIIISIKDTNQIFYDKISSIKNLILHNTVWISDKLQKKTEEEK